MSAEAVPLTIYTLPSHHVRAGARLMEDPYQRVVGILQPDGERLWSPRHSSADSDAPYDLDQATERTLDGSERFNGHLLGFFASRMAGIPPAEGYNCHSFGRWMKGAVAKDHPAYQDAPDYLIVEGFNAKPPLALGQNGVIGYRFRESPSASHTVVGLGREVEECVQIMGADSYLGITSYDDILAYYDPKQPDNAWANDYSHYGLYV